MSPHQPARCKLRLISKTFSMFLLLILTCQTPVEVSAEELNIFWYTDASDILSDKKPDVTFDTKHRPFYGSIDPEMPNEKEEVMEAMDAIRSTIQPQAGDMNRLGWDPVIDAKWQAQRCDGSLQTTLAVFVASKTKISYKVALSIMASQGRAALKANKCKMNEWHRHCVFYRNILQGVSNRFYCARSLCPGAAKPYRVHCDFRGTSNRPPQMWTGMLYTEATPCSLCPRDRGYCYKNLCVSGEEKAKILQDDPSAIVTCDAPCKNCGVRKDIGGTCSCQCITGYTQADCSSGSAALPASCGSCQRRGTPCQNGGRDSAGVSEPCKCLCRSGYTGTYCEIPVTRHGGGVHVPIETNEVCLDADRCTKPPPSVKDIDKMIKELKEKTADGINRYCKASQSNYVKCCGSSGTLPTSDPLDFIDSSKVHVVTPVKIDGDGRLIATVYTSVPGNNGLCRKTTTDPPPMVPVPPEVLKEVIDDNLAGKKTSCCDATVKKVIGTEKDQIGTSAAKKINCITVMIG